MQVVFVTDCC